MLLLLAAPAATSEPTVSWLTLGLFALLPAVLMTIGGALAAWRPPGEALRSALLHFAAGVVFAVVAVELLPDIIERHAPIEVGIGFGLGVAVMLGLRAFTRRLEAQEKAAEPAAAAEPAPGALVAANGVPAAASAANGASAVAPAALTVARALPWGLLVGVGIDILVDGLLLGLGFVAGAKEGMLLAVALGIEVLALGLATAVQLRQQQGLPLGRTVGIVALLALLLLVGAGLGTTLLRGASDNLLELVLSFGMAALLFLVTEELLLEAHEGPETPWLTSSFFAGFLVFLLLGMLV